MADLTLAAAFPRFPVFNALALAALDSPDVADLSLTLDSPDVSVMPRDAYLTLTRSELVLTLPKVMGASSVITWRTPLGSDVPGREAYLDALSRLGVWLASNGDALAAAAAGLIRRPPTVRPSTN